MNPTRLRLWIRKYGDAGVVLALCWLVGHHLWTRRRTALVVALALLTGSAGLVLWAHHPASRHKVLPTVSASVALARMNAALLAAVRHNDVAAVSDALHAGANVNAADSDGDTALIIAAETASEQVAQLLLQNGANVNANSEDDCSKALRSAVKRKHTGIVRLLLEGGARIYTPDAEVHLACPDEEGFDLLGYAASKGCNDIVLLLLHHGAKINFGYGTPGSVELIAAAGNHHIDTASLLLAHGSDINWCGRRGTALSFAAEEGDLAMVRYLVAHGADVNATDNYDTVLLHAVAHAKVVRFLMQHGAKVDMAGKWDITPLVLAARNGDVGSVRVLLEYGADVNYIDEREGKTPLKEAAKAGHLQIVRTLLRWGAKINLRSGPSAEYAKVAVNKVRTTVLEEAKKAGHADIVRLLKRAGARE